MTGRRASPEAVRWRRVQRRVKRVVDVLVAGGLLVLLSPLLVGVYLTVRLTSPGGGLFRQTRVGTGGRPFVIYKFRTMAADSDERSHRDYVCRLLAGKAEAVDGLYKLADDSRVTPVGSWLRRTSLDELPQLLNVLRGEMSLVGPRPVLDWERSMFPAWAAPRFEVPPGITGLWQISGRNRLTMTQGLHLDVRYVSAWSLWLDAAILLRTVPALLRGGAR